MKHKAIVWRIEDDGAGIIKRKGLDYPDEDPTVRLRLSEHDLLTDQDSFPPADFSDLADGLTPPLYGLADLAYIHDEDCLPTSLQTPLFNLKALELLEKHAPDTFTSYPVLVMEYRMGEPFDSVRELLASSRVRLAPEGYALIKAHTQLDRTSSRAEITDQGIALESDTVGEVQIGGKNRTVLLISRRLITGSLGSLLTSPTVSKVIWIFPCRSSRDTSCSFEMS